jgi:hypothetical protein
MKEENKWKELNVNTETMLFQNSSNVVNNKTTETDTIHKHSDNSKYQSTSQHVDAGISLWEIQTGREKAPP